MEPEFQQSVPARLQYELGQNRDHLSTGLPSCGANLSATDFFSIPLQINTYKTANPETPVTTLTRTAPTATVFSSVAALSNDNSSAVLTGANGVSTQKYGQVLRVVSPATVPNPAISSTFEPHISFVRAGSISTPIRGSFNPAQSFNLNAVIDPNGDLVMTGTVTGVPVAQTKIVIASRDLPDGPSRRALQGFGETCADEIEHGGLASPLQSKASGH